MASSSQDGRRGHGGSTKFWDLGTGQETAKAVPEGFTFPKRGFRPVPEASAFLAIAREVGDRVGEGRAHGNLGNAHGALRDYRAAIACHTEALAIAREVRDRAGEGRAHGNLGRAHHWLGDYRAAIACHKEALAIAREVGDRAREGRAHGNLGTAHEALRDYRAAIACHTEALTIARGVGGRAREGLAHGNLGGAHQGLGDYDAAMACYREATVIAHERQRKKQRINSYVVAAKGQTLCISKAADDKAETAADGKAATAETAPEVETATVAFFQCASEIRAFDVSELERSHITVDCTDGQVLQLQAAVLLT